MVRHVASVWFIVLILGGSTVQADQIILKDGEVVEGRLSGKKSLRDHFHEDMVFSIVAESANGKKIKSHFRRGEIRAIVIREDSTDYYFDIEKPGRNLINQTEWRKYRRRSSTRLDMAIMAMAGVDAPGSLNNTGVGPNETKTGFFASAEGMLMMKQFAFGVGVEYQFPRKTYAGGEKFSFHSIYASGKFFFRPTSESFVLFGGGRFGYADYSGIYGSALSEGGIHYGLEFGVLVHKIFVISCSYLMNEAKDWGGNMNVRYSRISVRAGVFAPF